MGYNCLLALPTMGMRLQNYPTSECQWFQLLLFLKAHWEYIEIISFHFPYESINYSFF